LSASDPDPVDGDVGFEGDSEQAAERRATRIKVTDENRMFFMTCSAIATIMPS
jgi:hypothetical protein